MLKRITLIAVTLLVTLSLSGVAVAGEDGNKRKGKYTYRKVYKACNARGEVDIAKPTLNPDAKTQAQWTSVFENKEFAEFGCQEEWSQLSDKELLDIYSYLHAHASDSPTPAKCK
ncbi:MAG: cytochrome c family protein [Desulfosarcinaceae bacterium]|nr:cytochrome c family protein [Desulfosarcinaceae bacterium]